MKRLFLTTILTVFYFFAIAQIPAGYYDEANGLTGSALKTKLHDIISQGFVSTPYGSLYTAYAQTDTKGNNIVWDMYSDIPGGQPLYTYYYGSGTCGNYTQEGDCYNREHSLPASWFNDATPMYSDLFHVFPTDGYVNNRRSNFPFGEVATPTWTSSNGSKLGNSSFPGYSSTVFEPIDAFKGDFARNFLYMAVRYKDEMPSWASPMIQNGDYNQWAINLLLKWHLQDTVSTKEINRNNAAYLIQHNRNPFIDHPEWATLIWQTTTVLDESLETRLSIYFNSENDILTINSNTNIFDLTIEVYSVTGQLEFEYKNINLLKTPKDIPITINNGIHLIKLSNKEINKTVKIIKI
ncbi:MAG: endonuclease [Bacteroidota bacterium]